MENQTNGSDATTQAVQQGPPKPKLFWRLLKIGMLVLLAIVVTCKPDCFIQGLMGKPAWTFGFMLTPLIFVILAVPLYLLYRLMGKLGNWRTTRFWTKGTYASLLLCLYFVPVIPSIPHRLGFYYWAKAHIDIPETVAWVETFQPPPDDPNDQFAYAKNIVDVPLEKLPPSIQALGWQSYKDGKYFHGPDLGPKFSYDKKQKALVLRWGSGMMGSWGVKIGRDIVKKDDIFAEKKINDDAYVFEHE